MMTTFKALSVLIVFTHIAFQFETHTYSEGCNAYVCPVRLTRVDNCESSSEALVDASACTANELDQPNLEQAPAAKDIISKSFLKNEALIISDSGMVANLIVSVEDYNALTFSTSDDFSLLQTLSAELYESYKDEFDFIFFSSAQSVKSSGVAFGVHYSVKNDTQGIGKSLFDSSASWGSAARLQGVIHFPYFYGLFNGPGLHEIMHRWGNSAIANTGAGGHWGFSSVGGQLGGWDNSTLQSLGNNQYQANNGRNGSTSFGLVANGGNSLPYSTFELYLMGMLPDSALETLNVAVNGQWVDPSNGIFSASSLLSITPQMFLNDKGSRLPSFTNSQKRFNVLNVVVSTQALSSAKMQEMDTLTEKFSRTSSNNSSLYNFWEATNGSGSLLMNLGQTGLKPVDPITPQPTTGEQSFLSAIISLLLGD